MRRRHRVHHLRHHRRRPLAGTRHPNLHPCRHSPRPLKTRHFSGHTTHPATHQAPCRHPPSPLQTLLTPHHPTCPLAGTHHVPRRHCHATPPTPPPCHPPLTDWHPLYSARESPYSMPPPAAGTLYHLRERSSTLLCGECVTHPRRNLQIQNIKWRATRASCILIFGGPNTHSLVPTADIDSEAHKRWCSLGPHPLLASQLHTVVRGAFPLFH